jgi:hypothetical protein
MTALPGRAVLALSKRQPRDSRGHLRKAMTIAATNLRDNSETLFATPEIVADRRSDGSIWLKSTTPLKQSARCVGDWLEHWARQTPDRIFLGGRSSVDAPWTTVTYTDALRQVRAGAAWILAQGLSAEHPLVILSDNSIEHASPVLRRFRRWRRTLWCRATAAIMWVSWSFPT